MSYKASIKAQSSLISTTQRMLKTITTQIIVCRNTSLIMTLLDASKLVYQNNS